jgi:hypothetical protein
VNPHVKQRFGANKNGGENTFAAVDVFAPDCAECAAYHTNLNGER